MNYYPNNYYLNYPYGNQYQQQMPDQAQSQTPQPQGLNGKIVDSQDVVRATEVPIGGYGIFPKADLSEIYIKSWNNNGTTSVITYKPEPPQTGTVIASDPIAELKEQIDMINSKIKIEPRVIQHLGQDLITSPEVAVVELLKNSIDAGKISFGIVPRINAAGRMGSAYRAFQLLTAKSAMEALEIAGAIEVSPGGFFTRK